MILIKLVKIVKITYKKIIKNSISHLNAPKRVFQRCKLHLNQ